jgi:hypothetical protein
MLMPGCKPKPKSFFKDKKSKEDDDDKYSVSKNGKDVNYDEWKKQFMDMVKVPSFQTSGFEVAIEKSSDPAVVVAPIGQGNPGTQSAYQPQEHIRIFGAHATADSRYKPPDAPSTYQSSSIRDPGYSRYRESSAYNDELARLRSEQELLRDARGQLQSELEEFKRRRQNENVGNSRGGDGVGGGGGGRGRDGLNISIEDSHVKYVDDAQRRQRDFKEMVVNQKFNEVMSVASPTSAMGGYASIGGVMNLNVSRNHYGNGGGVNSDLSNPNNIGGVQQFPSNGLGGPF